MTKTNIIVAKPGNGKPTAEDLTIIGAHAVVIGSGKTQTPAEEKKEPEKPVLDIKPEPAEVFTKAEMTLMEKILKVENLQLVIEKRSKLVQTRSELERFQTASNDFNCSLRLNDSDGNVFTTSFTPGIKKVIDFLKLSFDQSINDTEKKIVF